MQRFIKDNIEAIEIFFKCILKVAALVFCLFLYLLEWVIIFITKLFELAKPKLFTVFELIKYCLFDKNKHLEREQNTLKLKKRRECLI